MDTEWFYLEAGEQRGPVSESELKALLRAKLPRATLVWRDGQADWLPAGEVPELAVRPATPPPSVPAPPAPPPLPVRTPASPAAERESRVAVPERTGAAVGPVASPLPSRPAGSPVGRPTGSAFP